MPDASVIGDLRAVRPAPLDPLARQAALVEPIELVPITGAMYSFAASVLVLTIDVRQDPDDAPDGYYATVRELPGVTGEADSIDEAAADAIQALREVLEVYVASRRSVPLILGGATPPADLVATRHTTFVLSA